MICSVSKKWPLVTLRMDVAIKHILKLMGIDEEGGMIFDTVKETLSF